MTAKLNIWHRHRARVKALQALYQWDFGANPPAAVESYMREDDSFVKLDEDYFSLLFQGVVQHRAKLDKEIAAVSDRDMDQLDLVVRNILRLGAYELAYCPEVSPNVIISQGVKLSQEFASEQAHTFVNGVLDSLQNRLRDEFAFIHLLRREIRRDSLGRYDSLIGDDCALLPPSRHSLISVDACVEDVHFPANASPFLIGYRSLGAAISDLAAMGAVPAQFLCAISLPSRLWEREYLIQLGQGIRLASIRCGIELIGGNLTAAKTFSLTMTVIGHADKPLTRKASQLGDKIFVSGSLGDASGGLKFATKEPMELTVAEASLRAAYYCSLPPLALGQGLRELAHSCIDISDGLSSDIYHLLTPLGANLSLAQLPLSASLLSCFSYEEAVDLALGPSDDYELLFTAPAQSQEEIEQLAEDLGVRLSCIGEVVEGDITIDGKPLRSEGYRHWGDEGHKGEHKEQGKQEGHKGHKEQEENGKQEGHEGQEGQGVREEHRGQKEQENYRGQKGQEEQGEREEPRGQRGQEEQSEREEPRGQKRQEEQSEREEPRGQKRQEEQGEREEPRGQKGQEEQSEQEEPREQKEQDEQGEREEPRGQERQEEQGEREEPRGQKRQEEQGEREEHREQKGQEEQGEREEHREQKGQEEQGEREEHRGQKGQEEQGEREEHRGDRKNMKDTSDRGDRENMKGTSDRGDRKNMKDTRDRRDRKNMKDTRDRRDRGDRKNMKDTRDRRDRKNMKDTRDRRDKRDRKNMKDTRDRGDRKNMKDTRDRRNRKNKGSIRDKKNTENKGSLRGIGNIRTTKKV